MQIVRGGKLLRFSRISLQSRRFSGEFLSFLLQDVLNCCRITKVFPRITERSANRESFPPRTICIIWYLILSILPYYIWHIYTLVFYVHNLFMSTHYNVWLYSVNNDGMCLYYIVHIIICCVVSKERVSAISDFLRVYHFRSL